jgi:Chalcone isomerase-like
MKSMLAASLLAVGALLAVAMPPAHAQPVEVEGVKFERNVQVGSAQLQLNGTGLRTRAIFKVYAAGLYVPEKSSDPNVLLAQKGPRRISLGMLRSVDADSFASALNDGLKNNLSEAQLTALRAQIDALNANLKAIGEAKKGDLILFEFAPDAGTRILVNGQPRGTAIAGDDFFNAILRIFIGAKPADADLKKGLLGA